MRYKFTKVMGLIGGHHLGPSIIVPRPAVTPIAFPRVTPVMVPRTVTPVVVPRTVASMVVPHLVVRAFVVGPLVGMPLVDHRSIVGSPPVVGHIVAGPSRGGPIVAGPSMVGRLGSPRGSLLLELLR